VRPKTKSAQLALREATGHGTSRRVSAVLRRGLADGTVVIAKKVAQVEDGDPVIGKFLAFLARDMANEPSRIRPVPRSLLSRGKDLVKGVKVDLDAPLADDEA